MHLTVGQVVEFLDQYAPATLAADWDNVGLLIGDRNQQVQQVMTCLTITPEVVQEALERRVGLIVTHHPLPFRGLKRITTDTVEGQMLWQLASAQIGIYSAHTAFDSAYNGINHQLAQSIKLQAIAPLELVASAPEGLGTGRYGQLETPKSLPELAQEFKQFLQIDRLQVVGTQKNKYSQVGIVCGSAGEFLQAAHQAGCDCFVTGEVRFHTCIEAQALGIGLILLGHYPSERFAMEQWAREIGEQFTDLKVWASEQEKDPVQYV